MKVPLPLASSSDGEVPQIPYIPSDEDSDRGDVPYMSSSEEELYWEGENRPLIIVRREDWPEREEVIQYLEARGFQVRLEPNGAQRIAFPR